MAASDYILGEYCKDIGISIANKPVTSFVQ